MTIHELINDCIKRLESIKWVGSTEKDLINVDFVLWVLGSLKTRIKDE